jgi:hypothetical protein
MFLSLSSRPMVVHGEQFGQGGLVGGVETRGRIKSELGAVDGWTYYCVCELSVASERRRHFPDTATITYMCTRLAEETNTATTCAVIGLKMFISAQEMEHLQVPDPVVSDWMACAH